MNALKTALAALIVLGSASAVLADDGTSFDLDTSKAGMVQGVVFTTKQVSLPQAPTIEPVLSNGRVFERVLPIVIAILFGSGEVTGSDLLTRSMLGVQ